jgi:hypothetical protein
MKTLIYTLSVFLISAPSWANTQRSGAETTKSATSGAVFDPSNTATTPPTLDRTNPVNGTGAEPPTNMGTGTGFGYTGPDKKLNKADTGRTQQKRWPAKQNF